MWISVIQKPVDWIFAHDFFVSYKQDDGKNFPEQLTALLKRKGFSVFLDTKDHLPGDDLDAATKRLVRMSKNLLVIARPGAMARSAWVVKEVKEALAARRRVVVIDVDGAFDNTKGETEEERKHVEELRKLLPAAILRVREASGSPEGVIYDGKPSDHVLNEMKRLFRGLKWETRKRQLIAVFFVVLLLAGSFWIDARAEAVATAVLQTSPELTVRELDRRSQLPLLNWLVECKLRSAIEHGANTIENQDPLPPKVSTPEREDYKDTLANQLASAAFLLLHRGYREDFWPFLSLQNQNHSLRTDLRLRYFILDRLPRTGIDPGELVTRLRQDLSQAAEKTPGVIEAIIIALGRFDNDSFPLTARSDLIELLQIAYRDDPDSGVHSAIAWLLAAWGMEGLVQKMDQQFSRDQIEYGASKVIQQFKTNVPSRGWYVTPDLHTMAIIDPRKLGPPESGVSRLNYVFAISTKEVTVQQWEHVNRPDAGKECKGSYCNTPARRHEWTSVYEYCDRVTEAENAQPGTKFFAAARTVAQDNLGVSGGYRLPTTQEWEYACRCGTATRRFFGNSDELLHEFAWFAGNSAQNLNQAGEPTAAPVARLLPNPLGLFDVYGNVEEYCITLPFLTKMRPTLVCGGTINDTAINVHSGSCRNAPADPDPLIGFRLVRTIFRLGENGAKP